MRIKSFGETMKESIYHGSHKPTPAISFTNLLSTERIILSHNIDIDGTVLYLKPEGLPTGTIILDEEQAERLSVLLNMYADENILKPGSIADFPYNRGSIQTELSIQIPFRPTKDYKDRLLRSDKYLDLKFKSGHTHRVAAIDKDTALELATYIDQWLDSDDPGFRFKDVVI